MNHPTPRRQNSLLGMNGSGSVSIAILTFRRPDALRHAIASVADALETSTTTVVEVIVVDNDATPSAASTVESFGWDLLRYVHEPRAGVATARNRALEEAAGDILIFIDDDERAGPGWPDGLVDVMTETGAGLVGGPVRTVFLVPPPEAIRRAEVFDRDEPADLATLSWLRSGNLAIDLRAIRHHRLRFDPRFNRTGGEDAHFSIAASGAGLSLRWSATAIVYEDVDAERLNADWVLRRARNAMSNFVRANAPLGARATARILAVAALRAAGGSCNVVVGALARDDSRRLRGRVALARSVGAVTGCRAAAAPSRQDDGDSSYDNGG